MADQKGSTPPPPPASLLDDDTAQGPGSDPAPAAAASSSTAEPPPYTEDGAAVEDDSIPAGTLRLAGNFIHLAESGPDAPALYELSLSIGFLRDSNQAVELSRLDYAVKGSGSGAEPQVAGKSKRIFTMHHPPALTEPPFPYYLEAESRSALGSIGIKTHRSGGFGSVGYRAWRVKAKGGKGGELVAQEQLFEAKKRKGGGSGGWRGRSGSGSAGGNGEASSSPPPTGEFFEWTDASGRVIATEDEGEAPGMHRLVVLVTLDRRTRDALVGTWCLRLWHVMSGRNKSKLSWTEMKRVAGTKNELTGLYSRSVR